MLVCVVWTDFNTSNSFTVAFSDTAIIGIISATKPEIYYHTTLCKLKVQLYNFIAILIILIHKRCLNSIFRMINYGLLLFDRFIFTTHTLQCKGGIAFQ